jgi:hypothetical protein
MNRVSIALHLHEPAPLHREDMYIAGADAGLYII